jgi:GNAT superfamily N-acetyltransferase
MSSQIEYKVCSKDDISDLLSIAIQSYNEHYTHLWADEGKNYVKNSFNHEQLLKEINNPNAVFFLVITDSTPVGFVKLNIDKAIDAYAHNEALELERIYFLKDASGKGLGKKTLSMIKELAKNRGKKVIWLKAMKGGAAHGFYQKQGFILNDETILNYPFIKEEYREMVTMIKML